MTAAAELAAHFNADLCLLHVLPAAAALAGFISNPWPPDGELYGDADHIERKVAEANLRSIIMLHVPQGVRADYIVRRGDATLEILRTAESEQADLIVMATHAATGWRRLLDGSTTEEEVRLAPCPVLCLHADPNRHARTEAE